MQAALRGPAELAMWICQYAVVILVGSLWACAVKLLLSWLPNSAAHRSSHVLAAFEVCCRQHLLPGSN